MPRLRSLRIHRFRNLDNTVWAPLPGLQLVLGDNGAGKTSLLEAVYALATSRSFRSARLSSCCRRGSSAFFLGGAVEMEAVTELTLAWSRSEGPRREVDGRQASAKEYLEVLPVVCWWRGSTAVLTGEPRWRRRLLDQGMVGMKPSSLAVRERFRRALAAKRELIVNGKARELSAWNDLFASSALDLYRLRAEYAMRLGQALRDVLSRAPLELPPVRLEYRPSPPEAVEGSESLRAALERHVQGELKSGRVLIGPQRDELELNVAGASLRDGASAGEVKVLGLALTVARARVLAQAGRTPVLLLDDADTELDRGRLGRVWKIVPRDWQTLVSSNRPRIWRELSESATWTLSEGKILGPSNEI